MGKLQQQLGHLNENDVLRELISACEKDLANLTAQSAHDVLVNADDAHALLARLETLKSDIRAEQTRLGTVDERIVKQAGKIVALLGGTAAYAALRQKSSAPPGAARWQLDVTLAHARNQRLRSVGIALAVMAVIVLGGYLARDVLFPPDPSGEAISKAQQELAGSEDADQLAKALIAIDAGLTQVPTDTQLLLWRGVLQEKQSTGTGQAAFDVARGNLDEKEYLLNRAQVFYVLGLPQRAVDDMDVLLVSMPESPEAFYIRAGAYESLGRRDLAIADLNRCADLAQAQGNDTLVATARVRLGMMMQQQ